MESLEFLQELYIPIVMAVCLIAGYIMKHWIKDVDNRIIPTVLAVLGAVCACVNAWDISLELIIAGAMTGLASTGAHQAFKQWIEKSNIESTL
ncbi:MAG: phage holin family protein [Clostridia bacterium]|nr:phage holin family protein [Clostridia bacterium]